MMSNIVINDNILGVTPFVAGIKVSPIKLCNDYDVDIQKDNFDTPIIIYPRNDDNIKNAANVAEKDKNQIVPDLDGADCGNQTTYPPAQQQLVVEQQQVADQNHKQLVVDEQQQQIVVTYKIDDPYQVLVIGDQILCIIEQQSLPHPPQQNFNGTAPATIISNIEQLIVPTESPLPHQQISPNALASIQSSDANLSVPNKSPPLILPNKKTPPNKPGPGRAPYSNSNQAEYGRKYRLKQKLLIAQLEAIIKEKDKIIAQLSEKQTCTCSSSSSTLC